MDSSYGGIHDEREISLFRHKMCISIRISNIKRSFCKDHQKKPVPLDVSGS